MRVLASTVSALVSAAVAAGSLVGVGAPAAADTGCPTASSGYSGGDGSEGNPYLISSGADLQRLHETPADWGADGSPLHYRLTNDLNMGSCTWVGSALGKSVWGGYTGLAFQSVLDGDNHVISDLNVSIIAGQGKAGLVPTLGGSGVIRDLGYRNGTVTAGGSENGAVGGLVGVLFGGLIENSWASVTVVSQASGGYGRAAGGLVGVLQTGTVSNSFATGAVSAEATSGTNVGELGGLVGTVVHGRVENSYATGTPTNGTGSTGPVGGLIGKAARGVGNIASNYCEHAPCIAGVTTTQAISPIPTDFWDYYDAGWDIGYGAAGTGGAVWGICSSIPYLSSFTTSAGCSPVAPSISSVTTSGTATVGETLTGTVGTLTGTPTPQEATYQWEVADTAVGTYTAGTGSGATSLSYTLPVAEADKYVRLTATVTNGTTEAEVSSTPVGPVSGLQLTDPTAVTVSSGATPASIVVTFTQPTNAPSGQTYSVDVYSNSARTRLATSVTGFTSGDTISGLTGGSRYWVVVTADASTGYLASTSSAANGYASAAASSPGGGNGGGGGSAGSGDSPAAENEDPVRDEKGGAVTTKPRPVESVRRPSLPPVAAAPGRAQVPDGGTFVTEVDSQRPILLRGGVQVPDEQELTLRSDALILEALYRSQKTTDARARVEVDQLVQLTGPEVPAGTQVVGWVQDRNGAWFTLGSYEAGKSGVAVTALRLTDVGEYVLAMTTEATSRSALRAGMRAGTKEPTWGDSVMRVFVTVVPKKTAGAAPSKVATATRTSFAFSSKGTHMSPGARKRLARVVKRCDGVESVLVRQGRKVTMPGDIPRVKKRAATMRTEVAEAAGVSRSRVKIVWWKKVAPQRTSLVVRCAD